MSAKDDKVTRFLKNVERDRLESLEKKFPEEHRIAKIKIKIIIKPVNAPNNVKGACFLISIVISLILPFITFNLNLLYFFYFIIVLQLGHFQYPLFTCSPLISLTCSIKERGM